MRRAARKDTVHQAIIADLRKLGVQVLDISQVGGGVPDIVAFLHGEVLLVELKSPKKVRGGRGDGLNASQVKFMNAWTGCKVIRAEDAETVLNAFINYHRTPQ